MTDKDDHNGGMMPHDGIIVNNGVQVTDDESEPQQDEEPDNDKVAVSSAKRRRNRRRREGKKTSTDGQTRYTKLHRLLFARMPAHVKQFEQENPHHTKEAIGEQIRRLELEHTATSNKVTRKRVQRLLSEKKWALSRQLETAVHEVILDKAPELVTHLRKKSAKTWEARIWTDEGKSADIQISGAYVVERILYPAQYQSDFYNSPNLRHIPSSHRIGEIEKSVFGHLRQINETTFEGKTVHGKTMVLTAEWVDCPINMKPIIVEQAKKDYSAWRITARAQKHPPWVFIDEGKCTRHSSDEAAITPKPEPSAMPEVRFQNRAEDWNCLQNALASGLAHLGLENEAIQVRDAALNPAKPTRAQINELTSKLVTPHGFRVKRMDLDLFGNSKPATSRGDDEIFLVGLPNKHCVSIVGSLVMDPDSTHCEALSQEVMDKACGVLAPYKAAMWAIVITKREREDVRKKRVSKKRMRSDIE